MATDPAPVLTPYRVFVFLSGLVVALSQLQVVSPDVKPWLIAVGVVISLALSVFFDTASSSSIVKGVAQRLRK